MSPSPVRAEPETTPPPAGAGVQVSLEDLEPQLSAVTFVVVDLETTGTRPGTDEITEIGAVRVRGGVIEAELSTFVAISGCLPPTIRDLTGIRPSDLVGAPPLGEVVSTFTEFARGAVLVAHNARFDTGFLRAAYRATGHTWPGFRVVCTLALARRILADETRSHRLGVVARYLGSETEPCHRALADARATVDVLHALIGRVGDCGVTTVSDLLSFDRRLAPEVRRRSALTAALTSGPGVYIFRDSSGVALYVGSSASVRARARSYFTGGDTRTRMRTMISLAETVEDVPCVHLLEARVTEDRLIDALQPPFNRRSRSPRRSWWLRPPRSEWSAARCTRSPGQDGLGPFRRADSAREVADALQMVGTSPQDWVDLVRGEAAEPLRRLVDQVAQSATEEGFERARRLRDTVAVAVGVCDRLHELSAISACPEIVLAQRAPGGTWALAVLRYGRLAGSGSVPRGAATGPVVEAVRAAAATLSPGAGPLHGATPGEIDAIHRWIDSAPTRLVSVEGTWTQPLGGVRPYREWAERARRASEGAEADSAGHRRLRSGPPGREQG